MKGLKRRINFIITIVCFGATLSSLTGCATTYSIDFTSIDQPKGKYKYAVITTNSSGESVLQRFYSKHPSDQYEVVAYELLRKKSLPFTLGLIGGLLGGLVGGLVMNDSENSDNTNSIIGAGVGAVLFGAIGHHIGDVSKDRYIITYVERPAPHNTGNLGN